MIYSLVNQSFLPFCFFNYVAEKVRAKTVQCLTLKEMAGVASLKEASTSLLLVAILGALYLLALNIYTFIYQFISALL